MSQVIFPHSVRNGRRRSRGFNLIEVMIAMAVLGVGFVAIASIFPTAGLMQKRTMDEVYLRSGSRSVEAIMRSLPIPQATNAQSIGLLDAVDGLPTTSPTFDTDDRVHPLPPRMLQTGAAVPAGRYPETLRGFPMTDTDTLNRRFYWVPLIRDKDIVAGTYNWVVYVFYLNPANASYPKAAGYANPDDNVQLPAVRKLTVTTPSSTRFAFDNDVNDDGTADQVRVGDQVLDTFGTVHTVVTADATGVDIKGMILPGSTGNMPDEIWYAEPSTGGGPSTVRRINVYSNAPYPIVVP